MIMGRKPVYTFSTHQVPKDINGSAILCRVDNKNKKNKSQLKNGNRCGHDAKNLRLYKKPANHKLSWHVIEESNRRLRKVVVNPYQYPEIHGLMHTNGRKNRTERREAEIHLLLGAIIDSVNLYTMQLGHFTEDNVFINYDYGRLVTLTNMSVGRVNRYMLSLKEKGLIDVKKIVKTLDDGHIVTSKVIITASVKIFEMLDTYHIFLKDREKAVKNRIKLQNKYEADQKHLELFRPYSVKHKKNKSIFKEAASLLKNTKRHSSIETIYNPAQDKRVLEAVGMLLKVDSSLSLAAAIKIVTDRNKSPPS